MRCHSARILITQQLRETPAPEVSAALTRHLARCSRCRAEQNALRALAAQLVVSQPAPVPLWAPVAARGWTERLLQSPPRPPMVGPSRLPSPRWVPFAAAGLLFALSLAHSLLLIHRHHGPTCGTRLASRGTSDLPRRTREMGEGAKSFDAKTRSGRGRERERRDAVRQPENQGFRSPGFLPGARHHAFGALAPPKRPESALLLSSRFRAKNAGTGRRPDDLIALNGNPLGEDQRWTSLPTDEWQKIEARVRAVVRVRDDFVTIPFPRLVSTSPRPIAEAVASYKREAAIVDPRLSREVTCAFKAAALSDLCAQLRAETDIELTAGSSVADEKVTVFCEKMPLRDMMRQLSRPFGYTWLRSKREGGEYRYELVQDLRSQLLEEELRNRDRDAALLALEKDLEQYRPYLDLSPDEALARAKTASPAEKPILEDLAGTAWGPLHVYFRLSSQQQAALRAGQELKFVEAPRPGEKLRPEMGEEVLPPEIARGVLQSVRFLRLIKTDEGWEYSPGDPPPAALPPAAIPEARAWVLLGLGASDRSQFTFKATDGIFTIGPDGGVHLHASFGGGGRDRSSAHQETNNAAANAALAHDPALGARVSVVPVASSPWAVVNEGPDRPLPGDKKVNSAEVLEALHQATGIPIVADFYTRLFKRDAVSVRNEPLFDALNKLGDAMRMRWHKEGGWLQLRSLTYFDDRRKEVPNRLLSRWAESRRQHGWLSLDDLVEIAQLPDAQLDAAEMGEGAREWWGLAEWGLACAVVVRPHLRYLARLTPEQRREAMSASGLPFTGMNLAQQQQFMAFGLGGDPLHSLDELAGATLRVEYTQPGAFQWGEPGWSGYYTRWVIPLGPDPQDHRALRPPVTARTRQETLAAVRRVDPQLREALLQAVDRADPRTPQALDTFEEQQIFPTQRNLTFVYIPGATNARSIFVLSAADGFSGRCNYRLR